MFSVFAEKVFTLLEDSLSEGSSSLGSHSADTASSLGVLLTAPLVLNHPLSAVLHFVPHSVDGVLHERLRDELELRLVINRSLLSLVGLLVT